MLKRRTVIRPFHPEAFFYCSFTYVRFPAQSRTRISLFIGLSSDLGKLRSSISSVELMDSHSPAIPAYSAHPRSLGLHAGSPCFSNPCASSVTLCFSKKSVFAESGMICGLTELFFGRITSGSCRRSQPAAPGGVIMVSNQPIHQNLSETVRGRAAIR